MEKEFVPYELVVKLKALGFDEECFGYYHVNVGYTKGYAFCYFDKPKRFKDGFDLLAPTFSQAFRWFREKHALQGYVYSTTVRGGKEGKHFSDYCWHINGIDMPFLSTDARDMENVSYEEAELACLTKLIEIVELKSE